MLFGGVLSDRWSPWLVMLIFRTSRCLIVAGLAALVWTHTTGTYTLQLWHLYTFSIVTGTIGALQSPANQALIPSLLRKEDLTAGNALIRGSTQLTSLIGPALAGIIITSVGAAWAFGIDSATIAFATLTLLLIKPLTHPLQQLSGTERESVASTKRSRGMIGIREGFQYAWRHPEIKAMLPVIALGSLFEFGPWSVGVSILVYNLTGEVTALGTVMAVVGGASLVGSLIAGSFNPRHRGILWVAAGAALGVGSILLGRAHTVLSVSLVIGIVVLITSYVGVGMNAWWQTAIRPDMMGRVLSLRMFVRLGLQPVSLVLAGWLIDINLTMMFTGAGILHLLTFLYAVLKREIRTID